MFLIISIFVTMLLLLPLEAAAWGPGTHVEMALRVLAHPSFVVPAIVALIKAFPEDFIYGVTSPDIIVGKKYAGYHYHCHNWRMGKLILSEAKSDRQRAATYGYLMHLAMDVVAHNYFVPFKIIKSHSTRFLSHVYWEMRFDLGVPDKAWQHIGKITQHEIDEFDELLERVLRKTLFSFSTNKRIFNSILILQKMRGMRESLHLYAAKSRWNIGKDNRQHYTDLTWSAVTDFLSSPETAKCLQNDPAGLKRIAYAQNLRRRIRGLRKRGFFSDTQSDQLVALAKEQLRRAIYDPEARMPDVVDVL